MDEKTTKQAFKEYRDWQRYILSSNPALSKGRSKVILLAYCFAMASHGTNGIGCYASDRVIARELGLYDFRSVLPYRNEAIRLGWFAWTGERKGRAKVLDIAIPDDKPADDESPEIRQSPMVDERPRVSADGHVRGNVIDCPACKDRQRKIEFGEVSPEPPLWQIHRQALGQLCV